MSNRSLKKKIVPILLFLILPCISFGQVNQTVKDVVFMFEQKVIIEIDGVRIGAETIQLGNNDRFRYRAKLPDVPDYTVRDVINEFVNNHNDLHFNKRWEQETVERMSSHVVLDSKRLRGLYIMNIEYNKNTGLLEIFAWVLDKEEIR